MATETKATSDFWLGPFEVVCGEPFDCSYKRPAGGRNKKSWIGLFRPGQTVKQIEGRRFYYDKDSQIASGLKWAKKFSPPRPGKWEMRYVDNGKVLASVAIEAKMAAKDLQDYNGAKKDDPFYENSQYEKIVACTLANCKRQTAFVLERGENINSVVYSVNVAADGKLDPENPIVVDWCMLKKDASGATREGLTTLETNGCYGIWCDPGMEDGHWVMTIVALKTYPLDVFMQDGKVMCVATLDGAKVHLEHIFIKSKTNAMGIPTGAEYLEFYGTQLEGGDRFQIRKSGKVKQ